MGALRILARDAKTPLVALGVQNSRANELLSSDYVS
jgi:hypothetical protein